MALGCGREQSRKMRDGARFVSWARFDGNLYLLQLDAGIAAQVLRVNAETGSIGRQTHRSIYFSPSGGIPSTARQDGTAGERYLRRS